MLIMSNTILTMIRSAMIIILMINTTTILHVLSFRARARALARARARTPTRTRSRTRIFLIDFGFEMDSSRASILGHFYALFLADFWAQNVRKRKYLSSFGA